jgi:CCR4-NOT transcription complex subunit 9
MTLPLSPKPIPYGQYNNPYSGSRLAYPSPPPLSVPNLVQGSGATFPSIGSNGILNGSMNNPNGIANAHVHMAAQEEAKIYAFVIELLDSNTREVALLELSKRREQFDDLALVLWHSFGECLNCQVTTSMVDALNPGVMAALLQEIVAVYPLLYPPALTAHASNRVCNALALLQCVASHSETRQLFLTG